MANIDDQIRKKVEKLNKIIEELDDDRLTRRLDYVDGCHDLGYPEDLERDTKIDREAKWFLGSRDRDD